IFKLIILNTNKNFMKKKTIFYVAIAIIMASTASFIYSCKSVKVPENITVVDNFKLEPYMGTWYEIARFDFKHEKDLSNVTATYSLKENGKVKVVNRGYNYVKDKWEQANGKATFVNNTNVGALKVSFFGPFYAGYNVVLMEPDYENVLVFGENTDYIWILSRKKTIPNAVKEKFLKEAEKAGYDLNRLVWTKHDK